MWFGPLLIDGHHKATEPTAEVPLRFRPTPYGIAPYLHWSFPRELIKSVTLGPKHNALSEQTCRAFLRWNGYAHVEVRRSGTPYR